MKALFEKIEGYGFECEGGPLNNCVDWINLKRLVEVTERIDQREPAKPKPVLYTDSINGEQVCRDDLWLVTTEQLRQLSPPSPVVPQWIPVGEKLPDSKVTWCWTSDGFNSYPAIWDHWSKSFDQSGPWCADEMRPVAYWMPMPAAPHAGE